MEELELREGEARAAADFACERGVCQDASAEHDVARLRVSCEQRAVVVLREDVPVVGHGKRRAFERLAVKFLSRGAVVEIFLHAGMHDELGDSAATKERKELVVLVVICDADARLDRDRQRRAFAHVDKKRLEPVWVAQKARALLLGDYCSRGAAEVEVDFLVAHVGKKPSRPDEPVGVVGQKLGHDIEALVVRRVEFTAVALAEWRSHLGERRDERRVVAVERAEDFRVNAAKRISGDSLHGGKR